MENYKDFFMECINSLLEGVHDKSSFKAIFLAGSPAAGKSFISHHIASSGKRHGLRYINSDEGFEYFLDKEFAKTSDSKYDKKNLGKYAQDMDIKKLRNKAKQLTNDPNYKGSKLNIAMDERLGLLIDGTGRDREKIQELKQKLENYGYETFMIFVTTTEEVAIKRNEERPRVVPKDTVLLPSYYQVMENLDIFEEWFSPNFLHIDNSEHVDNPEQHFYQYWKQVERWLNTQANTPQAREFFNQ